MNVSIFRNVILMIEFLGAHSNIYLNPFDLIFLLILVNLKENKWEKKVLFE